MDFEENEENFPMWCAEIQISYGDHWSTRTKVVEDDDASWCQTSWLRPKIFFQLPLIYIEMKNQGKWKIKILISIQHKFSI